jgi:hypothetical protein
LATGVTGFATPVTIKGLQRSWNVTAPDMKISGVGVLPNDDSVCNGVLVEIDESEIPSFDKREMEGTNYNYERLEIQKDQLLQGEISPIARIWVYAVKTFISTPGYPIAQSYLDVILKGCLEFSETFAGEFF